MNKDVKSLFETFCKLYNLRTSAKTRNEVEGQISYYSNDFIKMDFNPHYGGYRIDIVEKGTGEDFFDGAGRKSKAEMCSYLRGLIAIKQNWILENLKRVENE